MARNRPYKSRSQGGSSAFDSSASDSGQSNSYVRRAGSRNKRQSHSQYETGHSRKSRTRKSSEKYRTEHSVPNGLSFQMSRKEPGQDEDLGAYASRQFNRFTGFNVGSSDESHSGNEKLLRNEVKNLDEEAQMIQPKPKKRQCPNFILITILVIVMLLLIGLLIVVFHNAKYKRYKEAKEYLESMRSQLDEETRAKLTLKGLMLDPGFRTQ